MGAPENAIIAAATRGRGSVAASAAVRGCLPGPGRMARFDALLADRNVRAVTDLHDHLGVLPAAIDTHRQALSA
ncbi:hypothetical protein ACFCX0_07480 [Streptomyces sp. NPDC056352]|uniref:hypothetical protein n=1 Tax=Streptomyces sp. NPDC056352 TaxID=3345791 RepID=UPI0035DB6F34